MTEYFKTIDEQINILKSRGLEIKDEKKAYDTLLRYNYYKIINATIPFFVDWEKNGKYRFREGVDFKDLVEVHNFDKELKKILLTYMLEIERIARSIISYKFVEKYPKKNSYLDYDNYDKKDISLVKINVDNLKETLNRYKEEKNYNRSINYYINKYGSVPFWFLVNFISFGKLVNIYETLDYKLQEDIADEFQVFVEENLGMELIQYITPSHLTSFLKNAKDIRNMSAHDNLILGYKYEKIEFFAEIHEKYNINENNPRDGLYQSIVILNYLIPKSLKRNMLEDIEILIKDLRNRIDEKAFENVLKSIGR